MSRQIVILPAGNVLTVTPVGNTQVYVSSDATGDFLDGAKSWGPYLVAREFIVEGSATVATSEYTTALNAYVYPNAGAPADAVQASKTVNPTGDDNALTFTAVAYGTDGNSLQIEYLDPGANSQSLAVTVYNRQKISVSLATNGSGTITSTATLVKAAIEADPIASDLVTVAIDTSDTGVADDGSGVVTAMALAAFTGGAGTGIGLVPPGGLVVDTTNGEQYRNTGTQAAPVWLRADARGAEEHTATGAVTAGVSLVTLNHATVAADCTIADAANHPGFFAVVNTSASGTAAHTLTLTAGTFDGTNNKATLNAPAESLLVFFGSDGNGTIIVNTGSVGLAAV